MNINIKENKMRNVCDRFYLGSFHLLSLSFTYFLSLSSTRIDPPHFHSLSLSLTVYLSLSLIHLFFLSHSVTHAHTNALSLAPFFFTFPYTICMWKKYGTCETHCTVSISRICYKFTCLYFSCIYYLFISFLHIILVYTFLAYNSYSYISRIYHLLFCRTYITNLYFFLRTLPYITPLYLSCIYYLLIFRAHITYLYFLHIQYYQSLVFHHLFPM